MTRTPSKSKSVATLHPHCLRITKTPARATSQASLLAPLQPRTARRALGNELDGVQHCSELAGNCPVRSKKPDPRGPQCPPCPRPPLAVLLTGFWASFSTPRPWHLLSLLPGALLPQRSTCQAPSYHPGLSSVVSSSTAPAQVLRPQRPPPTLAHGRPCFISCTTLSFRNCPIGCFTCLFSTPPWEYLSLSLLCSGPGIQWMLNK